MYDSRGPSKYYFNDSAGYDTGYDDGPRGCGGNDPRGRPGPGGASRGYNNNGQPQYDADYRDDTAYQFQLERPSRRRAQSAGRTRSESNFPNPGVIKYRKADLRGVNSSGGSGGGPYKEKSLNGLGTSTRSLAASMAGSERSSASLRTMDREFDRYLRLREGKFDTGPSQSYKFPNYNALLDPIMGEHFDRGGRRSHLIKSKLVTENGQLTEERKWKELHYQETRKAKMTDAEWEQQMRDEISENHKMVSMRHNQAIEERRRVRIDEIREDHRERVNRIRQVAMKRLEKYTGPGNFWLAFKAANAFASLLTDKKGGGGKSMYEGPEWEDRAIRMIQRAWRGKIARRVAAAKKLEKEAKKQDKEDKERKKQEALKGAYVAPSLVSSGGSSFKKRETSKKEGGGGGGSPSVLVTVERTPSGRTLQMQGMHGMDVTQGGRASEDLSPLEGCTLEDRKEIIAIQSAARGEKARERLDAIRQERM